MYAIIKNSHYAGDGERFGYVHSLYQQRQRALSARNGIQKRNRSVNHGTHLDLEVVAVTWLAADERTARGTRTR